MGRCYPASLAKSELLPYYARHFKTVEINSTFYHLPTQRTLARWLDVTPKEFLFTLKANRSITHHGNPGQAADAIRLFIHTIKPLRDKLGAILFQFPPSLHLDMAMLDSFLSELPQGYRYAVEFRHSSWMEPLVFDLLALHGVALCLNDFGRRTMPWLATAAHIYIRMHGPTGRYGGSYTEEALQALCGKIEQFGKEGREVFCYFNNDSEGYAWENTRSLIGLCAHEDQKR
jgi:uncharacterized protein YecE (DUF72 family)